MKILTWENIIATIAVFGMMMALLFSKKNNLRKEKESLKSDNEKLLKENDELKLAVIRLNDWNNSYLEDLEYIKDIPTENLEHHKFNQKLINQAYIIQKLKGFINKHINKNEVDLEAYTIYMIELENRIVRLQDENKIILFDHNKIKKELEEVTNLYSKLLPKYKNRENKIEILTERLEKSENLYEALKEEESHKIYTFQIEKLNEEILNKNKKIEGLEKTIISQRNKISQLKIIANK